MPAEIVIPYRSGNDSTSEHFDSLSRSILSAYMLHLVDVGEGKKNFAELFKWAGSQLDTLLAEMSVSSSYPLIFVNILTNIHVRGTLIIKFNSPLDMVRPCLSSYEALPLPKYIKKIKCSKSIKAGSNESF